MAAPHKTFTLHVVEDFNGGSLNKYLSQMTDKMQRGAIRKMVAAAGKVLTAEVRKQIKQRDMPYSRASNAAERRKARQQGTKPLVRTVATKAWSRPARGIIGSVVGPSWPSGAHGHLVERGHRITGKARVKFTGLSIRSLFRGKVRRKVVKLGRKSIAGSGQQTVAHHFQSDAMDKVQSQIFGQMQWALTKFISQQGFSGKR